MKRDWFLITWLLGYVLFIVTILYMCSRPRIAKEEREIFVQDSIARANDSIKNTPEYKAWRDSIDREWDKKEVQREKNTLVLCLEGDTVYHYNTSCFQYFSYNDGFNYHIDPIDDIRIITEYDAKKRGMTFCTQCEEMESVYSDWESGDLMTLENAKEYMNE